MIEDHIVDICSIDAIWPCGARLVLIAQTDAQVAGDDVRSFLNVESLISQADAVARRRLASDCQVRLINHELRLEENCPGQIEDDRTRTLGRADSVAQ